MKAVILAGGLGTRISEETDSKPKPMVEIGGRPILWHLLKIYSFYGVDDFIICCGYKGYVIKEYFANHALHTSDVTIDIASGELQMHVINAEPWRVTLVDTGDNSMTGERLRRVRSYLEGEDIFCFTYGDGLSNVDVNAQIKFHRSHGKLATITAVTPPPRYGALDIHDGYVTEFVEKPSDSNTQINGGFFLLSQGVFDYIDTGNVPWEQTPLQRLATDRQLVAYKHDGFWQPMDTLRDKRHLEELWVSGNAPWKIWRD